MPNPWVLLLMLVPLSLFYMYLFFIIIVEAVERVGKSILDVMWRKADDGLGGEGVTCLLGLQFNHRVDIIIGYGHPFSKVVGMVGLQLCNILMVPSFYVVYAFMACFGTWVMSNFHGYVWILLSLTCRALVDMVPDS